MENSARHLEIIDYLYGEMNSTERKEFEEKMKHDSELRKEVESLRATRETFGKLAEKGEPDFSTRPMIVFPKQTKTRWIRTLITVAASIAILMLTGYFTHFSVRNNDSGLVIGFNKETTVEKLDKSEVEQMINEALAIQQAKYNQQMAQTRDSLQKVHALLAQIEQPATQPQRISDKGMSGEELRKQIASWQTANRELLQKYLTTVNEQQQEYLKDALMQFSDYLQEQRENDLDIIRQNLVDLKYYQDQQTLETNQTLAGLIQTVNQKSK